MTENQKLREALQKIIEIKNKMEGTDWEEIEEAREIARHALATPTAAQVDDINVAESFTSAAPVVELPELPLPTSIPGFYDIEARKRCVYTADQMRAYALSARAALSAGDAVDGLPGMEPVAWLISVPDEPDLGSWLSEEPGADYCKSEPLCATAAVQQYKEDAQRWKTSELISRAALTHPDKRTEQMNIAFNAYRKAMESGQSYAACVDAAIDTAMRKGQL